MRFLHLFEFITPEALAQKYGVRFDCVVMDRLWQFTDPTVGTAGGATFTTRVGATEVDFVAKLQAKRAAFGK